MIYLSESPLDRDLLNHWRQEDKLFIQTKACGEVEDRIQRQILVIVVGHSGSGKTAIIQHISLKYRRQGWFVKPVKVLTEIVAAYLSNNIPENKTLFILNDPIGKESFDEIAYSSWEKHSEHIELRRF